MNSSDAKQALHSYDIFFHFNYQVVFLHANSRNIDVKYTVAAFVNSSTPINLFEYKTNKNTAISEVRAPAHLI